MAGYDFSTALVALGGAQGNQTLLDVFKLFLGIALDDTSQDEELSRALNMAGDAVETYLDRVVAKRAVTEYFPHHFGTVTLHEFPLDPLDIPSVTLNGDVQSDYQVWVTRSMMGQLSRTGRRPDMPLDWRPFAQANVTYLAGYDPIPSDLANAMVYTANAFFAAEGSGAEPGGASGEVKSMSIYDVGSISYDVGSSSAGSGVFPSAGVVPATAAAMLSRYKRMSS